MFKILSGLEFLLPVWGCAIASIIDQVKKYSVLVKTCRALIHLAAFEKHVSHIQLGSQINNVSLKYSRFITPDFRIF